jgi:3-oxoacyl-[acyl-carrier protein] reductase
VAGSARALGIRIAAEAERRGALVAVAPPPAGQGLREALDSRSLLVLPDASDDPAGCERLVDAALAWLPRLDSVITPVVVPPVAPPDRLELEQWQQRVIAPLSQAFHFAKRVVWEFLAEGAGGRLVFVTAPAPVVPTIPGSEHANEVVAAALLSLARSIAKEVGSRSVACNVVMTAMDDPAPGWESRGSAPTPVLPIVEASLYLASEDASFVNGEALTVRG